MYRFPATAGFMQQRRRKVFGVPFILFVITMTGTPGPGNLAHMAIGQSTGFRSALPFLAGTTLGAVSLDTAVGFGLGKVMMSSPLVALGLKMVGAVYILYLAWKVVNLSVSGSGQDRRFSFGSGLLVHPLSPKSWVMAIAGFSQFSNPAEPLVAQVAVFVFTFMFFQVFFHSLWCVAGVWLMRLFSAGAVRSCINVCVAVLMVGVTMHALLM